MRQRDFDQLPHLVVRFLHLMPQHMIIRYKPDPNDKFWVVEVLVKVRPMSCKKGHIRVALKGPEPEDKAFFNISYKEAQKAAQGGVGEVHDLVQEAAGDGMDFIEGNHKLWRMMTG